MVATAGGVDVLIFTGGVGEHAPEIRAAACEPFGFVGVSLDLDANSGLDGEGELSAADAQVRTFIVTAREDVEIAGQVRATLSTE
jgi:acetate kinase